MADQGSDGHDGQAPLMQVIQSWAAIVWADGIVASAEGRAMKRLIDAAPLSDDQRRTAYGWLDESVDLPPVDVSTMTMSARRGAYAAALRLATADGNFVLEEGALLEALRRGLDLSQEEAAALEAEILERPRD